LGLQAEKTHLLPFAKKILETPEPPLVFVYDDFSD
jgi:hypothetical protein